MNGRERTVALALGAGAVALLLRRYFEVRASISKVLTSESLNELQCGEGRPPFAPALPSLDDLKKGQTKHGRILRVGPLVLQRAQFNALWIRVGAAEQPSPSPAFLRSVVNAAIAAQGSLKRKAAIYLAVSDVCLERGDRVELAGLRQAGFRYHHYRPVSAGAAAGEAVFVCDLAKMVPSYGVLLRRAALRPPTVPQGSRQLESPWRSIPAPPQRRASRAPLASSSLQTRRSCSVSGSAADGIHRAGCARHHLGARIKRSLPSRTPRVRASCECARTHLLVLTCSCSLARAHLLVLTCSCSLARTHLLVLTCSCSLARAHLLVLTCSYSLARAHLRVLTCSCSLARAHLLVLTCSCSLARVDATGCR
jgi:hypothetical protein